MTIKTKLLSLSILVFVSFVSLFFLEKYTIHKMQSLALTNHNLDMVNINILKLRKDEKDFLVRKDLKYFKKFDTNFIKLEQNLNVLKNLLTNLDIDTKNIHNISSITQKYREGFIDLVNEQKTIGLTPEDALYGKLRKVVHLVQDETKKLKNFELLAGVYDLRKQEKDFMLRKDMKYIKKFKNKILSLINNNSHIKLNKYLKKYQRDFLSLVLAEQRKGLTPKDGLLGKMRSIIQQTEMTLKKVKQNINLEISNKTSSIETLSFIFILLITIIVIFISFTIGKDIVSSLKEFEKGLIQFFKYLNNEIKDVELLNDKKNDEIGLMSKLINKNIRKTQALIEEDNNLIKDATSVANKIKLGYLDNVIKANTNNESLSNLKNVINEMLKNLNYNINNILNVLSAYSSNNYIPRVDINNVKGEILELCNNTNVVGNTISNLLKDSKSNAINLEQSAESLLGNVDSLNKGSNETAASLEETAAALEEITSTIINNTSSIENMTNLANKVIESAEQGEKLAKDTATSMDVLNEQVLSINEAIGIIDQIAFQTNILSLNAAVEAATAGEAGKGFAVVAQEVRNLASRSSEAAKEIKELVENATFKASHSKDIAKNMINGYAQLNIHIQETIDNIKNVAIASKEQREGIEQINDTISKLDQQTQNNASIANETQEIAKVTNSIASKMVAEVDGNNF